MLLVAMIGHQERITPLASKADLLTSLTLKLRTQECLTLTNLRMQTPAQAPTEEEEERRTPT
jgi:hypothetical protein